MSAALSKKQQKALAFRNKQKAKKRGGEEPEDLPEADLIDEEEPVVAEKTKPAAEGKKRKREEDKGEKSEEAEADKADKKGKGKKEKAAAEGEEDDEDKKKSKKDIKQRFILFIGNLGFKTTRDQVAKHFSEAAGRTPAVRLLTEKPQPGAKTPPKSRGIAFLELLSSTEMQACMKLHHSILNQRRINVELTAGGGGKSATRKGKIAERNSRVGEQRGRKAEKEAEEAAKNGLPPPAAGEGAQGWKEDDDAPDGFKMRGGRRVKVKAGDDRAAKRSRTDGDGGWAGRGGSGPRGGGGGRKKWEPTGANALAVGN